MGHAVSAAGPNKAQPRAMASAVQTRTDNVTVEVKDPAVQQSISLLRECFAESLGTAAIVIFGCGTVSSMSAFQQWSGGALFGVSFSFGTCVYVMVESLADVSGAHFNPAVTLTLFLVAGLPWYKLMAYCVAQFAGAFVGGGILFGLAPTEQWYNSGLSIAEGLSAGQALGWELIGTLAIVFPVLLIAVRPGPHLVPPGFPIGLAVCFACNVTGPFTGGGMNPARALGAVVYHPNFWSTRAGASFWVYIVGPLLASLVGPALAWLAYGDKVGMELPRHGVRGRVAARLSTSERVSLSGRSIDAEWIH